MARLILIAAGAVLLLAQDGAIVRGHVRDARGQPLAAASIQLKTAAQTITTTTDSNGGYRFPSLPAASYTLHTASQQGEASFGPFALQPNEDKTVELTLAAAQPEFFDQPTFIVAGVADSTNRGGHGSDAILRSSEALAKAATSLGNNSDAAPALASEKSLREAIVREPDNAGLHHSLADLEERLVHPLEAVHEYQRAAELDPSERNLFDWGAELLAHHTYEPAIEVFSRGNRLFPRSTRMLLGLAVAYYATGSLDQAAQRFFEATDLHPENPDPYLFLAKTQTSSIAESEGYFERMARFAKLHPDNAWANYYYAVSLWKHKRAAGEVQALLDKAIRIDHRLAAAYLERGIIFTAQKDFGAAIESYQRAIAIDPRLEEAHYQLAQSYARTGEAAKAKEHFAIHDQLTKEDAAQVERERREVQQFVIELRKPTQ